MSIESPPPASKESESEGEPKKRAKKKERLEPRLPSSSCFFFAVVGVVVPCSMGEKARFRAASLPFCLLPLSLLELKWSSLVICMD